MNILSKKQEKTEISNCLTNNKFENKFYFINLIYKRVFDKDH